MSEYRFFYVPPADIDASDELYRISVEPADDFLRTSVAAHGLFQPLLVESLEGTKYRLVNGFRRFQVVCSLHWPVVPPPTQVSLFERSLQERLSSAKPLNPLEIATVLFKLSRQIALSLETIVESYLPLLGLGHNRKWIDRYLPLVDLDQRCKLAAAQDRLSLDILFDLPQWSLPDRHLLLDLFQLLHLGKNQQKEMVQLLQDLCRLRSLALGDLLQQPPLPSILGSSKLTTTQKAERCKGELLRWRYPRYQATQQAFADLLKTAHLAPNLRLLPPPYFNSDEYSLSFIFKSKEEYQQQVRELQRLDETGVIEKMVKLS